MNEEILGGLKSATNRGETLQQAMMTFYNAGYKREEIEESAKFFQQGTIPQSTEILKKEEKIEQKKISNEKVSSYGTPNKKDRTKRLLITLISITSIIFLGLLILFFLL